MYSRGTCWPSWAVSSRRRPRRPPGLSGPRTASPAARGGRSRAGARTGPPRTGPPGAALACWPADAGRSGDATPDPRSRPQSRRRAGDARSGRHVAAWRRSAGVRGSPVKGLAPHSAAPERAPPARRLAPDADGAAAPRPPGSAVRGCASGESAPLGARRAPAAGELLGFQSVASRGRPAVRGLASLCPQSLYVAVTASAHRLSRGET